MEFCNLINISIYWHIHITTVIVDLFGTRNTFLETWVWIIPPLTESENHFTITRFNLIRILLLITQQNVEYTCTQNPHSFVGENCYKLPDLTNLEAAYCFVNIWPSMTISNLIISCFPLRAPKTGFYLECQRWGHENVMITPLPLEARDFCLHACSHYYKRSPVY